ncbi:hypothetical protein N44_03293 [Microcystis aeruginosa NIES-44]|uniref:Uncharacterized protein n=1 Tax=Microcystis aeruginosa NIES-44 TaxID=449439 RepID=A0A0A1VVU5_MICAE|nr:hypothetical protein N44_03293 [Microcystis aeruginosa NIES-44]
MPSPPTPTPPDIGGVGEGGGLGEGSKIPATNKEKWYYVRVKCYNYCGKNSSCLKKIY